MIRSARSCSEARSLRFSIRPPGWQQVLPAYPTLADVDSAEALAAYQAQKRAYKQRLKAEGGTFDPRRARQEG